jgi:DNA polymerase-3 subunit delta'
VDEIDSQYLPWQAEVLERALTLKQQQHLPQAVMIDSPSDQDLSAFAWYLSTLLLCDAADRLSLCNQCQACRLMRNGAYSDFNLVTLEEDDKTNKLNKNIKISQIRKLIHEVSLTRQYERLKIAVIYPAEAMNNASANALLKTLEEPASGVLLLLLTHLPGRIPVTLRSRCQSWSIALPSQSQALDWLREQGMEGDTVARYLQLSNGDPVLALKLKQQDYLSLVEQFRTRLGPFLRGQLAVTELCRSLLALDKELIRRLVDLTLNAYCYQNSGVDIDARAVPGADRSVAQALLGLRLRAQQQLRVEENNLDLQLQLEDVLISLKQILTRRLI